MIRAASFLLQAAALATSATAFGVGFPLALAMLLGRI